MSRIFLSFTLFVAGCAAKQTPIAIAPAKIDSFQGEYRFLSNFWPAEVEFEGSRYPTAEHAYQAAKTLDLAALATPSEAKRAGRALPLRADWEQVKFDVMEQCVRYKFTHNADLRRKLLATGDACLEEGNTWGDRVWGVYQGQGENRLGKILMEVREELTTKARRHEGTQARTDGGLRSGAWHAIEPRPRYNLYYP